MIFMITAHSDIGIQRKMNQDALLIKTAASVAGNICLCVLCDGMGGLDKGELASATVIRSFERWFENQLGRILEYWSDENVSKEVKDKDSNTANNSLGMVKENVSMLEILRKEWTKIIIEQNQNIAAYAAGSGIAMGTTVVALLLINNFYYVMHVGDSRCYKITDEVRLLTKDHTMIQYQIDHGIISEKEAINHPGKGILLQCIGASDAVVPDFAMGHIDDKMVFVLCSDGFCHRISGKEIYEKLKPDVCTDEQRMSANVKVLTELNKKRHETDNISAAVVKVCQSREGDWDGSDW